MTLISPPLAMILLVCAPYILKDKTMISDTLTMLSDTLRPKPPTSTKVGRHVDSLRAIDTPYYKQGKESDERRYSLHLEHLREMYSKHES